MEESITPEQQVTPEARLPLDELAQTTNRHLQVVDAEYLAAHIENREPDHAEIEAHRSRAHNVFSKLVRATYSDIHALAHRLTGDHEDAQDVTQETLRRAFNGLRNFRGDAKVTTWLHRITVNTASTHLERRAKHRHEQLHEERQDESFFYAKDTSPEEAGVNSDLRTRVEKGLGMLSARYRVVIELRDIHDLTHEQIAEKLGISESASKVRLHRARRQLKDYFEENDPTILN